MQLKFKINKKYLLSHALKQHYELPFPKWENLQNKLWKKFPFAFHFYSPYPENIFLDKNADKEIENAYKQFDPMIKMGLQSKEFKRLYKETQKYLLIIEKQWKKNEKQAFKTIEELSRLTLPDKIITVYITHPKLRNGIALIPYNAIAWGHSEDWKNYSTVYICHEIMHLLTLKKSKKPKIMHALIEFITDDEIRIRLNKKGFYPQKNIGYPNLYQLKKKILPDWKKYLKDKEKNIFDLEKEIKFKN